MSCTQLVWWFSVTINWQTSRNYITASQLWYCMSSHHLFKPRQAYWNGWYSVHMSCYSTRQWIQCTWPWQGASDSGSVLWCVWPSSKNIPIATIGTRKLYPTMLGSFSSHTESGCCSLPARDSSSLQAAQHFPCQSAQASLWQPCWYCSYFGRGWGWILRLKQSCSTDQTQSLEVTRTSLTGSSG